MLRNKRNKSLYFHRVYILVCPLSLSHALLCDSINCSPPGSSIHGILQARILEWVAISFSKGSSWPRDWTNVSWISCTGRQIFYFCAPGKPRTVVYHPQNNFLVLYSELFITMWHVTISMRFCVCVCVCVCILSTTQLWTIHQTRWP